MFCFGMNGNTFPFLFRKLELSLYVSGEKGNEGPDTKDCLEMLKS